MDATVKELWVKALRSGEYTQGFGKLRSAEDEYCCLGVLCELAVKQEVIPPATMTDDIGRGEIYYYDRENSYLPERVQEWAGIDARNPDATPADGIRSGLGNHNDSCRHDFNSIADMIEASL